MIQTLLFVAGLNTLAQTLFGSRLPAVIGGSYTFVAATISIILAGRFSGDVEDANPIVVFLIWSLFQLYYLMFGWCI